jgi:glycosyltransferase involved in cell wall biosynthesis
VPLVAGLRGADLNTIPSLNYGLRLSGQFDGAVRRLVQAADATVFVSKFLERQGVGLGARPDRTRVILKGVELRTFQPARDREGARRELDLNEAPLLLAVAGLVRIKGVDLLLRALALVRRRGLDFRFIVCGEGAERASLERMIVDLALADCVRLVGRVSREDIPKYFAAADLFLHGAVIEASGNVLLEAMASALPIVCTDAGGPAEYVADGITGFVVPVGDERAMADRIALLLANASLRQEFGQQGRRRAEMHLGYDRMIDETLATYRAVLRSGGSQATESVPARAAAKS